MFGFGYNKEKSRAAAEKYLQQNKLQNAIAEYEKILKAEPKDLTILNTVGDVYARLGENAKAIERFRIVADAYIADGANVKALALYKKMSKLDPTDLAAMEKLAELYRRQGLVADARSQLLHTAEAYTRRNQSRETLRILKQLVLFDPENVQVIIRTADLMIRGGKKAEAREMLSKSASTLLERRALEPASKVLERLISIDGDNLRAQEMRAHVTFELGDAAKAAELYEAIPDLDSRVESLRKLLSAKLSLGNLDEASTIARKLATVHGDAGGMGRLADELYKRNDILRAIEIYSEFAPQLISHNKEGVLANLQGAVSRVRSDPDALQSLYELFQRVGESTMFAEILELLGNACVQGGQLERARDVYKQLIEMEPENVSHLKAYSQICTRLDPSAPPPPVAAETKEKDAPQALEQFRTDSEPDLPPQSYAPQIEETIAAALSEAEIYESHSSKKHSIGILEQALTSAPEDLRLLRTLGQLYRQAGDTSKSSRCFATMQRVLEQMGAAEAAAHYANFVQPGDETTWETKGTEFTATEFELTEQAPSGGTEEVDLSDEWESVWEQDSKEESPAPAAADNPAPEQAVPSAGPEPAPAASPTPGGHITELLEEARFCLSQQIWSEAEAAIARLAEVFPEHPELEDLRAQLQAGTSAATEEESSPEAESTATEIQQEADGSEAFDAIEIIEVTDDASTSSVTAGAEAKASEETPVEANLTDAATATEREESAPRPAPFQSLHALAAELESDLGEEFSPVPQPPRRPAPAGAPPVQAQAKQSAELQPPAASDPLSVPEPEPITVPAPEAWAASAAEEAEPLLDLQEPTPLQPAVPDVFDPAPIAGIAASADPFPPPESPLDAPASVFGDLIEEFESELAPEGDGNDDPESHFSLGLAFRDMGLLDEAIGELQKVCHQAGNGLSDSRAQQAYIWLATCFVEKSVPEASFKWFQRALDAAPDEAARTAVTYELASAYQAAGRKQEALEHFLEVYGSNIDYRDVASRIRELRTAP